MTIFVILVVLILFIRSPWGQGIITDKLTHYISDKTHTEVSIKKLFITFSGDITLKGIYLEDKRGDTLLYSKKLTAEIPLWPIIKGNPIVIDDVEWTGLRANIYRKDSVDGFNYQFLIDAFASDSTAQDTTGSPPEISIGSIDFSDFKVNYEDKVAGTKAKLDLGKFHFQGKDFDLEEMRFEVEEIALKNTELTYIQSKPIPPETDTTETKLPFLGIGDLSLHNVIVHYRSIPDGLTADANLSYFLLQAPVVDLADQSIKIGQVALNDSKINVVTQPDNKPKPKPKPEKTTAFSWPDWEITVQSIAFKDNHLHFQSGHNPKNSQGFDPDDIDLRHFTPSANALALSKNKTAKATISDFSFDVRDGMALKKLGFSLTVDNANLKLQDIDVQTNNSGLFADMSLSYPSVDALIDHPENSRFNLAVNHFSIDPADPFYFAPELKSNDYLNELGQANITGKVSAKGSLADVNLSAFLVEWQHTTVSAEGKLHNLTDPDHLKLAMDNISIHTDRADLVQFISEDSLGIAIPDTLSLKAHVYGGLDNLKGQIALKIPEGEIKLDGRFRNKKQIAFDATLDVIDLDLGKLLENPEIGKVAFLMKASGSGNSVYDLDANLDADFSELQFNGYDFQALKLSGNLADGDGKINLAYNDPNLKLEVVSKIRIDSLSQKVAIALDLKGADLQKLGLTEKDYRTRVMLTAKAAKTEDKLDFAMQVSKGILVQKDKSYYLGKIDLTGLIKKDTTSVDISSDFLNGKLRANADPGRLSKAIGRQLKRYFSDSIAALDTVKNPVQLHLDMSFKPNRVITQVFLPELKTMDTLSLAVDFKQKKNLLTANLALPSVDYDDKTIDGLQFSLNSTADKAQMAFGFNRLDIGDFRMNRSFIKGDLEDGILNVAFNSYDDENQPFYALKAEVSGKSSNLKIRMIPDGLLVNGKPWQIPADNRLLIQKEHITAHDFVFSRKAQEVRIANDLLPNESDNIGIGFTNFKLATFLALFNPDELLATGIIQGKIVAIHPFQELGLNAAIEVDSLAVLQTALGKLSMAANPKKQGGYGFSMGLKGSDVDLDLSGDYSTGKASPHIALELAINRIGLKTIAELSGKALTDGSGYISGEFKLKGDLASPKYHGFLKFNETAFEVSQLNEKFRLADDKIKLDEKGLYLDDFSIEDENGHKFTLDGSIYTKDLSDPKFDLSVKADDFQAMNSTEEDSDLLYGTVNFDADGTITGKASFPKVDLALSLNKGTNITYVLPASQAAIEKRDGIVEFVNKENPDAILTRNKDSIKKVKLTGIQLHTKIHIDDEATFHVIVDPRTHDNLEIAGSGDLIFDIARNGRMSLLGKYTVDHGHYKMSLYNLVKRKFIIVPGSSISWHGDPMDADLDITARYEVKTSPLALMSAETANAGIEVKNQYRERLPFYVFLEVKGRLDQPRLNFYLGMPEEARGAVGGSVWGRVNQINDSKAKRNKQVFSLLVLNRFYPEQGSDGSQGGQVSIVRENLNKALSDQLNAFSDRLMGDTGIQLNFGLESYTDYSGKSVEERTDLNVSAQKKLFNDRVVVQVGGEVNVKGESRPGEEGAMVGNASVAYLLTKDGRWRIKGFRKNTYENVIDGQVFVNGIALIFQRQFNKFSELWEALFHSPEPDMPKEKAKKDEETNAKPKKEND